MIHKCRLWLCPQVPHPGLTKHLHKSKCPWGLWGLHVYSHLPFQWYSAHRGKCCRRTSEWTDLPPRPEDCHSVGRIGTFCRRQHFSLMRLYNYVHLAHVSTFLRMRLYPRVRTCGRKVAADMATLCSLARATVRLGSRLHRPPFFLRRHCSWWGSSIHQGSPRNNWRRRHSSSSRGSSTSSGPFVITSLSLGSFLSSRGIYLDTTCILQV